MDTTTLLIVFLLVSAATLASYALSHWSSMRSAIGFSWAASSVGTTLLLIAAAIVVLTYVFKGAFWRPNLGAEQQLRESAGASKQTWAATGAAFGPESPRDGASEFVAPSSQATRALGHGQATHAPAALAGGQPKTAAAALNKTAGGAGPIPLPPPLPPAFSDEDPWAATRCVYIYNPGSDPTHWKIENGCTAPVGIILSWCSGTPQECGDRASTGWKYPSRPMVFPMQLQRPLALDEQTVHGREVRYVACFLATPAARELIAAPSEERSSTEWRERFESARREDGCLTRVHNWSDEGRRTGMSIDAVLGIGAQFTGRGVPLLLQGSSVP